MRVHIMAQNNNNPNNTNSGSNAGANNQNRNNQSRNNRNHSRSSHHRNGNNSNNVDNLTKFTLGNCETEGKKYEFRYDSGTYSIVLLRDEENFDVVLKTKDKEEAYPEWNKIKRPERKAK